MPEFIPIDHDPFAPQIDGRSRDLAVRTILGEAAREPDEGQQAVAAVILNRLNSGRYGKSIPDVVLAKNQFEPWNTSDGRSRMMAYSPESQPYQRAAAAFDAAFAGNDPTQGATHFFSPSAQSALGRRPPTWAQGEPLAIGAHNFYAPEGRVAQQTQRAQPQLVPVDHDPFAKAQPFVPHQPDSRPDIGRGNAAAVGAIQGLTANFGDEIVGARAAAGLPKGHTLGLTPFVGPLIEPAIGAARLGYEYLTGGNEATQRYEAARDKLREQAKTAEQQYPGTYMAAQVGGSLALPVGGALNAATIPVRMARGAGVGAGYGALAGAGEGENLTDRAVKAGTGAAVGGVVGAVAPPVVELGLQAARYATAPVRRAIQGTINPDDAAARRIATGIRADEAADPNAVSRLTRQEFDASQGQGVTLMDLGGERTRAIARSAANTSQEGRGALNRTIDERFDEQSGRIGDWLRHTFHFPNAEAQREAIEQTARAVNRPAYRRAFDEHANPMWDEALQGLASDPVMQSAIRRAATAARTERTMEGYRPLNNPFEFQQSTGNLTLRTDPNGKTMYPDLQFWDLVKRELDKQGTRESQSFARTLRNHLDELTGDPQTGQSSYATARQGAAGFFGAENALEAGQNFVGAGGRYGLEQARSALANMRPEQRQLFQDGYVSRFVEMLGKTSDRRNVLNLIGQSPAARSELQIALGRGRATELEARLRVEGIMDLARGTVQGNSTTARQWAELGLAGGAGGTVAGIGATNMDPGQMAIGAMVAALAGGRHYVNQNIARRVAEMLVSNDPAVIQRGVERIARNERMMDALRSFDARIGAVGGVQGGSQ